jgi:hypothetical protein
MGPRTAHYGVPGFDLLSQPRRCSVMIVNIARRAERGLELRMETG